jgi:hypothetical protein
MRTSELHDRLDDIAGPAHAPTEHGLRDVHRRVRRSRRWTLAAATAGLVCLGLVAALIVRSSTEGPRIESNPDRSSLPIVPATPLPADSDALGLRVDLPAGWVLQSGECPDARAVTVVDQANARPVPAGCPAVDGPWMVIQRIPDDLEGIDMACGPGLIDNMPMCQANQEDPTGNPNAFGIERRLYAGLDVLVSIGYDKRVGGGAPGMAYADPAVVEAVSSGAYQIPQPLLIAEQAIEQAAALGCQAPNAQLAATAVADCSTLTFPSNIVVKEAGAASPGGTVPATYTIVSLTGEHETIRYRALVQNRWNTQTRWVDPVVTHIERYDGPWPPDPTQSCQTPPIDPRFKTFGPDPCSIPRPSDPANGQTPTSTTADPVPQT